jgi:Domain of unknown function (DUF4395)
LTARVGRSQLPAPRRLRGLSGRPQRDPPARDATLGRGNRSDGASPRRSDARWGSAPRLFSFPNPVNEVSARLVAAGVVVMCVLAISLGWRWATAVIAYGFVARVLTGPKLSPLGQFVTRAVTPRLPFAERPVPGPPKRFAQGIGASFSLTALALALSGLWTEAQVVLGLLAAAAFLESVFALCLGCKVFALLMRAGVIPVEVCQECNNIWAARRGQP